MGGGGGKGGSQTQKTEIPKWIEEPATRNLARAEQAQQLGYMPYYGVDVAGFTPTQQAAQQMTFDTANAFGMMPQGYGNITPQSGMPSTMTQGGITGYSSAPLYEQAVAEARRRQPETAGIYDTLFGQQTGYTPKGG
jgi:hypothetical protein